MGGFLANQATRVARCACRALGVKHPESERRVPLRKALAPLARAAAMDDLPAVEPIKIYENTYRMPAEATR